MPADPVAAKLVLALARPRRSYYGDRFYDVVFVTPGFAKTYRSSHYAPEIKDWRGEASSRSAAVKKATEELFPKPITRNQTMTPTPETEQRARLLHERARIAWLAAGGPPAIPRIWEETCDAARAVYFELAETTIDKESATPSSAAIEDRAKLMYEQFARLAADIPLTSPAWEDATEAIRAEYRLNAKTTIEQDGATTSDLLRPSISVEDRAKLLYESRRGVRKHPRKALLPYASPPPPMPPWEEASSAVREAYLLHVKTIIDQEAKALPEQVWRCPVCDHRMTEEQSKAYRGCPTGMHFVQHVLG